MPKQRQIPRLFPRPHADGSIVWHWKPSKTLRAAGFRNVDLGAVRRAAIEQAEDLNAQVEAWRKGVAATDDAPVPAVRLPKLITFAELVIRYKASDEYKACKPKTQTNYASVMRQLETWALDGTLLVRDIDKPLVKDLKKGALKVSAFTCGSILRVLRLLLNWAKDEGIVDHNATDGVRIPEPPARKVMMVESIRDAIVEAADALGMADVVLAIELGFWSLQRQRDVLDMGRMAWRELDIAGLDDVDPRHLALLADPRGRVMAFRLCQGKTGTWIDAPMPPMFHEAIERAMRATNYGYVFPHPERPEEAMPSWMFNRRFRRAREAAVFVAIGRGDTAFAEQIDRVQHRDLRRTGMTFYKNSGASIPRITTLSGHAVIGQRTILDTYMPGDTAGAIACVAAGLRAYQAKQQRIATG